MVPPQGTRDDEPVSMLLDRMRGEIEHTFARYRLQEQEAEEVLQEILFMLIYLWDRIGNRELWMVSALRRACLRRLEERQAEAELPS
jgi:DNA-directed RNA polymerase specialized sigma24 family protein